MSRTPVQALVPPAAQAAETALVRADLFKEPIDAFEVALGGRAQLVASLAIDDAPRIRDLVEKLIDPHYKAFSLAYLAETVDITLTDLLRAYRNATLAKAQILATQFVAEKLPAIVKDIVEHAVPFESPCAACDGQGVMSVKPTKKCPAPDPATIPCRICNGKKVVMRQPSLDHQRLALELGEILKPPKGGTTFLQQFNLNAGEGLGATKPGSLEQMQQAVTGLLFNRTTVIDLEPVEPPHGE